MYKKYNKLLLLLIIGVLPFFIIGGCNGDGDSGNDGDQIPFADAEVFFEFNATDLDLGIQIFFDAEGWLEVEVSGPNGTIFRVENAGSLMEIGSTELFTESEEPELDEFPIEEFLALFPEGEYQFSGTTVDGDELVGTAELTHDLPAAPNITSIGNPVIEWCDTSEEGDPAIVRYQVIVEFVELDEFDEETGRVFEFSVDVLADPEATCSNGTQSVTVPPEFFESLEELDGEFKAEVLASEESGNKTISEQEFELE
ncbi:MAG: hypothetical protein IH874_06015 [Candidatus Dadabacteria bacterium]|nr:hypothetical protein [Candidatus Dadabacteria bacterium]